MPGRRTAGTTALLMLTAGAYAVGGGTGHATDGPGPGIEGVALSTRTADAAASELRPVPTVRFTVKLSGADVEIKRIKMRFERGSNRILEQGDIVDCSYRATCTRSGNAVKVTIKLFVVCDSTAIAMKHPGEYQMVLTVTDSKAAATTVRPSVARLTVKRDTSVAISVSPKQARKGETLRFSARMFRYTALKGRCNYANFAWKGQPLQLWFDPTGSAKAKKVLTAKTGSDEFARFKPKNPGPGVWTVRYAGDSSHAAAVSAKREIKQLR